MATVFNNVKLKNSNTTGKKPNVSDLVLGEVAVNTADGKAFMKVSAAGSPDKVVEVGESSFLPKSNPSSTGTFLHNGADLGRWAALNPNDLGGGTIASETAPLNPPRDSVWWKPSTGETFVWYSDGDSSQWVQVRQPDVVADPGAAPVGMISAFMLDAAPIGWIAMTGSVPTATYPSLAVAVPARFISNGQILLQDLRDEFIRGASATRPVGTKEGDAFKSHTHTAGTQTFDIVLGSSYALPRASSTAAYDVGIKAAGGEETRPRNVAYLWCIKAFGTVENPGVLDASKLATDLLVVKATADDALPKRGGSMVSTPGYTDVDKTFLKAAKGWAIGVGEPASTGYFPVANGATMALNGHTTTDGSEGAFGIYSTSGVEKFGLEGLKDGSLLWRGRDLGRWARCATVVFAGATGEVLMGTNISSVVRRAVGKYTVNTTSAMTMNISAVLSCTVAPGITNGVTIQNNTGGVAGSAHIEAFRSDNSTAVDPAYITGVFY